MAGINLNMFNRYAQQNRSQIAKALTSATGVGGALSPQSLQKVVTNTIILLSPEIQMISARQVGSKTPEFNRLTSLPAAVGAMGEAGVTRTTQSAYERVSVTLKVIRRKGVVTNFIIDASSNYIDAYAVETENQIRSHVLDVNASLIFGNKTANVYDFDGYETNINTNRIQKVRAGVVPTSLKELDDLIDATNRKGAANLKRYFSMSPEMLSTFTRLETTVRKNIPVDGRGGQWGEIYLPGGVRLESYRGIPIVQSTWMKPIEQMSPTVTPAAHNVTGSLSDGLHYFNVAPVTRNGEQEASTETNVTLSGGGSAQSIKITLSAAHSVDTYYYKIYGGTTSGATKLLSIVPAFTYLADGTIDVAQGLAANPFVILSMTADATVTTVSAKMANDLPLVANSGIVPEVLGLICVDPIQGMGDTPFANVNGDLFTGLVSMQPVAATDDNRPFLVKSYCAIAPAFEATSAWVRGLRTA
jgi:hypothetical protein